MSTICTASMRGRGDSMPNSRGGSPVSTQRQISLGGEQQVLVERVGREGDFHPFAATGDDRKHRRLCIGDPHVVL